MDSADLVIRGATIVDGSGAEAIVGDLAVRDGRIVAVGSFEGEAREQVDASGLVLAPGFIDIHTHFDPQLCWDGLATPSLQHGVTTIVTGNCSLSLAPVKPEGVAKVVSMFEVIEDIKKRTFDEAVPFAWESFPEYLDFIRGRGIGVNVGALVGHSALRLYVMGADAQKRTANDEELETMCGLLEQAMEAGALGLSSSYVDIDENMDPVPSRFADLREKIALCRAMAKSGRGIYQVVPYFPEPEQQLANIRELGEISRASGVPCSLQPILSAPGDLDAAATIAAMEAEREQGARVYGQVFPRSFDLNMRLAETSMLLFGIPGWKRIMDLPMPDRLHAFADPDARESLVDDIENAKGISIAVRFLRVGNVVSESNEAYRGRTLIEIAQEQGKQIGEVILDIAVADGLETEFHLDGVLNSDKDAVAKLIDHPLCHFGASDAGAHITQFCGTGDTTHLLEHYVRETGRMTLERAVHRMTGEVARDWQIRDRGVLAEGMAADLVLFDLDSVRVHDETFVNDFPGEANRYLRDASGYHLVVVNGEVVMRDGEYTNARPGQIV